MRFALRAILPVVLLAAPAAAQTQSQPQDGTRKMEVGTTVICDTQQQMERFVTLLKDDAAAAMNEVNAEANDPTACIAATMAYFRGDELSKASSVSGTYNIVRVLVVGVNTPQGFQMVMPSTYFSIVKSDEVAI